MTSEARLRTLMAALDAFERATFGQLNETREKLDVAARQAGWTGYHGGKPEGAYVFSRRVLGREKR